MSQMGQSRRSGPIDAASAYPSSPRLTRRAEFVAMGQQAISFNHLVSLSKQDGRHGKSKGTCGLAIDDKLERGWLFDRKIGWFGAFQDLVHIGGGASEQVGEARAERHQASILRKLAKSVHGRKAVSGSKSNDPGSMYDGQNVVEDDESLGVASCGGGERRFKILGPPHFERL